MLTFDCLPEHASLWVLFKPILKKRNLAQAYLFNGPRHAKLMQFATRLMGTLNCKQAHKPCGECQECHLLLQQTHPDVHILRPEASNIIKIEQVRALQSILYQTPQRGNFSFAVIEPADKLNIAAANALLKILEEPPPHVMFILLAEQSRTIPATILSRCQTYDISGLTSSNLSEILNCEPDETSARGQLLRQKETLLQSLNDVIEQKATPLALANQLSNHSLDDILWLFYYLISQAIHEQLLGHSTMKILAQLPIKKLFQVLDKINHYKQKTQQNISLNLLLALEDILLDFCL